jgi:hypothetical protein
LVLEPEPGTSTRTPEKLNRHRGSKLKLHSEFLAHQLLASKCIEERKDDMPSKSLQQVRIKEKIR